MSSIIPTEPGLPESRYSVVLTDGLGATTKHAGKKSGSRAKTRTGSTRGREKLDAGRIRPTGICLLLYIVVHLALNRLSLTFFATHDYA